MEFIFLFQHVQVVYFKYLAVSMSTVFCYVSSVLLLICPLKKSSSLRKHKVLCTSTYYIMRTVRTLRMEFFPISNNFNLSRFNRSENFIYFNLFKKQKEHRFVLAFQPDFCKKSTKRERKLFILVDSYGTYLGNVIR